MVKYSKLALGVIIALISLCITLITLVPPEWMTQSAKFLFAFTITAVSLAILYFKEISERHREYGRIKDEIGYMPRSIKYEKYRREHDIDPRTGDVKIKYDLKIVNVGDDNLNQICVPVLFGRREIKRRERSPLTIEKILLNNSELEDVSEVYTFESIARLKNGTHQEKGYFRIPLDSIDGLEKKDKCNIMIQVSCFRAFRNVRKSDWISVNIFHPVKVAELVVLTKGNWVIKPIKSTEIPESVQIHDRSLNVIKHSEIENAPKPTIRRNIFTWKIQKPKLSYEYKLHFKITRKRR